MAIGQALAAFWRQLSLEATIEPPLTAADRLVIAVSGGPDSLALLHAILTGQLHPPEQIIAAHLNHGWRDTAANEAQFVAHTVQSWGVAGVVGQANAPAFARQQSLSLEEASRQLRYQFLQQTAVQHRSRFILTGHQADDQAETVLHHVLRGSGLTGLRGMLPVSRLQETPPIWLLRPLLAVPRQAIDDYCRQAEITAVDDPSNQDRHFLRNRLRAELLPLLHNYNPQISQRLQNLATIAAAEVNFLEGATRQLWTELILEETDQWLRLDLEGWRVAPLALRRRLLREAVHRLASASVETGLATIEQARQVAEQGPVGAESILPGGTVLRVAYDWLEFAAQDTAVPHTVPQLPAGQSLTLPVPGQVTLLNGWRILAEPLANQDLESIWQNQDPWQAYLDGEWIAPLLVRGRLPGERFAPLGMAGQTVPLKRFMIDRKIPAQQRANWPIVADEAGLVWLVGYRLAERVRVRTGSRQIIRLVCSPID